MLYNALSRQSDRAGTAQADRRAGHRDREELQHLPRHIDGRKVTDNEIKQILKDETDSAKRQQAWLASKQVGEAVAGDIIRLVKLRNQAARKLGFNNYHTMALATGEQDVKELDKIFAELYELTNEPFRKVKAEIDRSWPPSPASRPRS